MYCRFTGEGSCRPKLPYILCGWETAASGQSFGDMTLEQFKQALQPYLAATAAFETIVYAAMGYTTKSTRSSGLTRRDAETPKETA